ncbi:MAG: DinB family protein [Dyadobacter sp.]|uniref:DinB family protein n=1 Tax=Dyadobacter sp. TaxID=1914288 RepID=UPI0032678CB5
MENTALAAAYLKEMEAEYASTKKCLERIPETVYKFKPHPKSMEMGYLTLLVAEIPMWITHMVEYGEIDFINFKHFELSTSQALLEHFEENFKGSQKVLQNATNESLDQQFSLKNNGQLLFSQPKLDGISSTINHWVHHRGQLTVYMRLNDISVPSIYGPSADDKTY